MLYQQEVDVNVFSLEAIGSCRQGRFIRTGNNGNDTLYYNYLRDGKFDNNQNEWIGLINWMEADDVAGTYLTIVYLNEAGVLTELPLEYDESVNIKAITMYESGLMFLNSTNKTLEIIDIKTQERDKIPSPREYNFLDQLDGKLFGIYETGIDLLDSAFQISSSYESDFILKSQKSFGDKIYLLGENKLNILDTNLSPILPEAIVTQDSLVDITVISDTIYILENDGIYNSSISFVNEDQELIYIDEEDKAHYSFHSFVDGSTSKTIIGEQQFETKFGGTYSARNSTYRNSISSSMDDLNQSTVDCSIEVNEINSTKTERERIPISNGDTIILYDYRHEISMSITNLGSEILNELLLVSNPYGGINCAIARYEKKHTDLNLSVGETYQLDLLMTPSLKITELCFNVISLNSSVDIDFSNNQTCSLISSDVRVSIDAQTKIYPNPTDDLIYIETKRKLNKMTLYGIDGTRHAIANPANVRSFSLSSYQAGIYILELQDKAGGISRHKLIVN